MSHARDVVRRIRRYNHGRDPERLALKYAAMAKSALAFLRGTAHLYGEDWPEDGRLNDAPATWLCGDLHIENVGTYRGDNRLIYFDIADFDEGVLAPCTIDLTRLATSVLVAARVHGVAEKVARSLCKDLVRAYAAALAVGTARWIERDTAQGPIKALMRTLELRSRARFVAARTELRKGERRLRVDGKHALPAAAADRKRLERFVDRLARNRSDHAFLRYVDGARRVAGTGSLGVDRYVILVEGGARMGRYFLLDLKRAMPSALAPFVAPRQPEWKDDAERVVAIGKRMLAVPPALLCAVSFDDDPYVLRELMPSQDKLHLPSLARMAGRLPQLAENLGALAAWSQLRSSGRDGSATIDALIEFAAHTRWKRDVLDYAGHYAGLARRDWKTFRDAWREGALG